MRSSPRLRSSPAFINPELVILLTFWVVYLAIMMTFAVNLHQRFGVHPVITVTCPLALCYALGWISMLIDRKRHGAPMKTTTSRQGSLMNAGMVILVALIALAGLAILIVEGVVVLVRALA